jgi:protease stability complex PrcB-like protein
LAAGGWLLYTQVWTGKAEPVAWHDLTPQLGRVEFTRKVTGVYRSRQRLATLLEATMPGRAPEPPRLDWSREQVVLIALGPRSSTGYSLRILRIVERRREITVYAREETPSLGDPVMASVTYPYRALALPRTSKSVSVKLEGRP